MNNQEKIQETEKFTTEEFFSQMKNLLAKSPEGTTYCVLALEDPEKSPNEKKEGILSLCGSNQNLTFLFSEAFRRSHEMREIIFTSVEFFKFMNSMKSPSSILGDILKNRSFNF